MLMSPDSLCSNPQSEFETQGAFDSWEKSLMLPPDSPCPNPQSEFGTWDTFGLVNLDSAIWGNRAIASTTVIAATFAIASRTRFACFLFFEPAFCSAV